jgi:hypothetical protein
MQTGKTVPPSRSAAENLAPCKLGRKATAKPTLVQKEVADAAAGVTIKAMRTPTLAQIAENGGGVIGYLRALRAVRGDFQ